MPEWTIDLHGMRCEGCVARVRTVLEARPAIAAVDVDLATQTARCQAPDDGTVEAACEELEGLGFRVIAIS